MPPVLKVAVSTGVSRIFAPVLKSILLLFLTAVCSFTFAQQETRVRGKISAQSGEPLPRVSVTVKGSGAGTSSDQDGNYEISAPSNGILVFSSVGYAPKEVDVNNQGTLNVVLSQGGGDLGEVVVVGYGSQRKKDVTGAVVSVSGNALREVPTPNLISQLQGRAAGIDIVSNSSRPGAAGEIRIRGNRSLATSQSANDAQNGPLLVVDGVPYGGSINDLNPDDINSIDILKDASATAIYGSRGSNGVIIVTTKRGRTGKAVFSYNGFYGIMNRYGNYRVFNGQEYAAFKEEARLGNSVNPGTSIYGLTPAEVTNLANGVSTDWQDLILKSGYKTNHDLSLSGGTETTQFGMGLGYYKETSVVPGQEMERFSLRSTIDHRVGKRVRIGLNTMNTLTYFDGEGLNPVGTLLRLSPLTLAYNPDGSINMYPLEGQLDAATVNPLTIIDNDDKINNRRRRFRTFNSLYGEVEILKSLKYRANIGLDWRQDFLSNYTGPNTLYNNATTIAGANLSNTNGEAWTYTIDNILTFDHTFAQKHRLTVTALYGIQKDHSQNGGMFGQGVPADYIQDYNFSLANTVTATSPTNNPWGYSERGLISYMGRLNYSFDDRYLLTATLRRDGSSVLSPGNQWFTYPAFALGWNISNESFMQNVRFFNTLKLRAGIGTTSNQSINPYTTLGTLATNFYNYGSGTVPNVNHLTGYYVNFLANKNLKWESTTSYNIGLDFAILNNRIRGSVDVYSAKTKDILLQQSLPGSNGAGATIVNAGKTKGHGVEVMLSTVNIQSQDGFSWTTDFNFALNREEIVELQDPNLKADYGNGWIVGQPLTVIYDVKRIGVWQSKDAAEAASYGQRPGQIRVEDVDKNGIINAADRQVVGNFQPDWIGGMTNRVAYKNFDLSVVMFARMGQTVVIPYITADGGAQGYPMFNNSRVNQYKVDYWTESNPSNIFPRPDASADRFNYASTLAYQDGSFIKIRSINLGYNLPDKVLRRTGISGVRVYVTAQNPFILYSPLIRDGLGLDPEGNGYGGTIGSTTGGNAPVQGRAITVNLNTPPTRQFLFGLNFKF